MAEFEYYSNSSSYYGQKVKNTNYSSPFARKKNVLNERVTSALTCICLCLQFIFLHLGSVGITYKRN